MRNLIYQCFLKLENQVQPHLSPERYGGNVSSVQDLYDDIALVSSESFRKYAEHIGCEYELDTERTFTNGYGRHGASAIYEWIKIIYDKKYDEYDTIAVFDLDVVPNTRENIFKASYCEYYGVSESDWLTEPRAITFASPWDKSDHFLKLYQDKYERHGSSVYPIKKFERGSKVDSRRLHFQGGMNVFTREGRIKARKQFSPWYEWLFEGSPDIDPTKRVDPIHYDDVYISSNVIDSDIDWEIIDHKWLDAPMNFHDPVTAWKDIKFGHFCGGYDKRCMLSFAHDGLIPYCTEYKNHPDRKIPYMDWTKRSVTVYMKKEEPESFS